MEKKPVDEMRARGSGREEAIDTLLPDPQPTDPCVSPEEIAALAVYLAGDMARSITGTTIYMDGGRSVKQGA